MNDFGVGLILGLVVGLWAGLLIMKLRCRPGPHESRLSGPDASELRDPGHIPHATRAETPDVDPRMVERVVDEKLGDVDYSNFRVTFDSPGAIHIEDVDEVGE